MSIKTKAETREESDIPEEWKIAIRQSKVVIEKYDELVKASIELAKACIIPSEDVIRIVFPRSASERLDCKPRLKEALLSHKKDFCVLLSKLKEKQSIESKKEAILARLSLTSEEKEILGIG